MITVRIKLKDSQMVESGKWMVTKSGEERVAMCKDVKWIVETTHFEVALGTINLVEVSSVDLSIVDTEKMTSFLQ